MATQKIEDQLITLAYSMALEPQRWHFMTGLMDKWLLGLLDEGGTDDFPALLDDSAIIDHLMNAMELMERQERKYNHGTSSARFIDSELEPAALISDMGRVNHCNQAAIEQLGFVNDAFLPKASFTRHEYDDLLKTLRKMPKLGIGSFVTAFNVTSRDGQNIILALSVSRSVDGDRVGRLTTISQSWHPSTAQQFQASLNLTLTELAITKTIVSGQTLAALAEQRGRTIGTVRNQLKALLAKLGLKSKTELVCLYSGYARFNGLKTPENPSIFTDPEPWRECCQLTRPDGTRLAYDLVGPKNGRPIMHFSDLISANGISKQMQDLLIHYNLRLIMPWRPGCGHSDPYATQETCVESFARDIEMLMDELGIEHCQTLGSNVGTTFQYKAGLHLPKRLLAHVSCAPSIPLHTADQMKQIKRQQRVIFFLARNAPRLIHMYCKFAMAKVEAGFDQEHVASLFEDSPYDLETMADPELRNVARNGFAMATMQGPQGIAWDLIAEAQLWNYLDPPYPNPILFLCADKEPGINADLLAEFVKNREDITLRVIEKAGTMLHLQHPDIVFEALDIQWAARTKGCVS